MRKIMLLFAMTSLSAPAVAKSDLSLASSFAKKVRKGQDLNVAFPGKVNAADVAALHGVIGCNSTSPTRQSKGRYFIIFNCGRKGAVVAHIVIADGQLVSIDTGQAVQIETQRVIVQ